MKKVSLLGAALISGAVILLTATWSLSAIGGELPAAVALPVPTGAFEVGRTTYEWTDLSRAEIFSPDPDDRRSLLVWVWYPAGPSSAPISDYLPEGMGELVEAMVGLPQGSVEVPAKDEAPLADTGGKLPVLVFSHGSGSLTAIYTAMLTEIASHGYVVVAIQHPYNALMTVLSDGRTIPASPAAQTGTVQYWSDDTSFVVDELERLAAGTGKFGSRLDLSRLGAFGHSFGGAASAEFCLDDARCVAGMNIDGSLSGDVEAAGVVQPFMQVHSGTTCEEVAASGAMSMAECVPALAQYRAGWQRLVDTSDAGYTVTLAGARHSSFSDLPLLASLVPSFAEPAASMAAARTIAITARYVLAFFDRYLKGSDFPFPEFSEAKLVSSAKR